MTTGKFQIDIALVRELIESQFPEWRTLDIRPVEFDGWDNCTFHLGDEMSVRLPSASHYVAQVDKEHLWLPKLAPHLPLPIPTPLARGEPGSGYPWPWSVYRWIDGQMAAPDGIADLEHLARSLGNFLGRLQQIDPTGGPPPGQHNFDRGGALSTYDAETRETLNALQGQIDTGKALSIWDLALQSSWQGPPVWVHGDVAVGNLLLTQGNLSAVIDFGCSAVGDPACDLVIAWTLFTGGSRATFRAALPLDEATWARARGWALWKAAITLAKQLDSHPREAVETHRIIAEIFADPLP